MALCIPLVFIYLRGTKEFGSHIDPLFILLRIKGMLIENESAQIYNSLQVRHDCALLSNVLSDARKGQSVTVEKDENHFLGQCLLKVARFQDKRAFSSLFEHFAPRIKAFLMKSGAHESLAEECVQETMAIVWRKSKQYDPSRASASTWIFTIARNKRIDAIRKQNRPEPDEVLWGPESEPDAADILALEQENHLLTKAVETLPAKQRHLVKRAFYGDLSHQEIAHETGLPLGTIKSRIRLALEKLRHEMKRV